MLSIEITPESYERQWFLGASLHCIFASTIVISTHINYLLQSRLKALRKMLVLLTPVNEASTSDCSEIFYGGLLPSVSFSV